MLGSCKRLIAEPILKFALNCLIHVVTSGDIAMLGLANPKPPLAKIATNSQEVFIIMRYKFKAHSPTLALDIDLEFINIF